ncbi:MAG: GDP-mannose 4,6-dehydratase [Acinetobacter sp.]|uniref:GDP-mannose 4,6-dehydratase n=1 Tax=Acinetobacter sp. TaxID=472 RepID=UPI002648D5ED|nr:GDP-mannose 4,6-dehydratase [Acinetobacter sp.]MDN5513313.1 GDP-mannose 4,6-dehydratase [Acinetobacter sp.]MDN5556869.1 GDP-mannose 4,6-dehydratase [Acinetobacter sp.]
MTTALITGINGFTGYYLAQELRTAGYNVVGLSSTEIVQDASSVNYICNVLDREKLVNILTQVKPDVVVHLAALAFVAHEDVDAIYRTNVVGTRNLLEAIIKSKHIPRSVLLASSANIYGNALIEPIDEMVTAAPANDYAVSKLSMEYMAHLWLDRLPITVVRPFNYTGVGQSLNFLIPKIVDHFKRHAHILELGNLDVVRDFSDVRSVVQRYRLLLESETQGEVFNVCSGEGHSLLDVLQIMREVSGHDPEIKVNPAFVRANEVHRLVGSGVKLDAVIGKVPAIPLKNTLQWMFDHTF